MNTKNLDAIKRMVTRLQSIRETENLSTPEIWNISGAISNLNDIVEHYETSNKENSTEVRID